MFKAMLYSKSFVFATLDCVARKKIFGHMNDRSLHMIFHTGSKRFNFTYYTHNVLSLLYKYK